MLNNRLIFNQTAMAIRLTLYIQAASDLSRVYGTVNVELEAGDSHSVEYGNLRNNMLMGVRVTPLLDSPSQNYCAVVRRRGDSLDIWLNGSDTIEFNMTRFNDLDVCYDVEDLIKMRQVLAQSNTSHPTEIHNNETNA